MPRIPQKEAKKGSQKWIQKVVNENPELLNYEIRKQIDIPENEKIIWLSPLEKDKYAEYRDQTFLDVLDLKLSNVLLSDFWPSQGPQWDALCKTENNIFLAEAKSHINEIISSGTGASGRSLEKIKLSLNKTKEYLNAKINIDWSSTFYQYTNRLAHLYFLRVQNNIPAYLLLVYFLNDNEMRGPISIDEWRGAISLLHSFLGIRKNKLDKYVINVFIDVTKI